MATLIPAGRRAPSRSLIGAAGLACLLVGWQVAALGLADRNLVASPIEVATTLVAMLSEPFAGHTLLGHLAASAARFVAGFSLAIAIGLPLGLVAGFVPVVDAIISPLFNLLRYVAPLAWVPFAVLWFGTGFGGPVLIIFSGAFSACLVGAHAGAKLVDRRLVEASRTLGAGALRTLVEVVLPSAFPAIVSAIRLAAGNAWQSLVGAELIVASSGVAYIMVRGQMNRTITVVMVGMVTIGTVGLGLDWCLRRMERATQKRFGRVPDG